LPTAFGKSESQNPKLQILIIKFIPFLVLAKLAMEDKSLCISLSRKGELPLKSIISLITTTFSAIS
jgi:hypothetical protein